jgi:hypothetical protein
VKAPTDEIEYNSPTAKYGHEATTRGAIKLDYLTLPKVIDAVRDTPKNVLVTVFCRPHSHLPEYKSLVDSLYNVSGLQFAEAFVDHSDSSPHGKNMERTFGLDSDKFPQYIMYAKKHPVGGMPYKGKDYWEDIAMWIDVNNELELPQAGSLQDFDKLVRRYVHSAEKDRHDVLQAATKLASESGDAKARHYVSAMQKVAQKGLDYVARERNRLSDVLIDTLPDDVRTELSSKLKVLNTFKNVMSESGLAKDDDEDI